MAREFEGQKLIVVGGTSGIGKAVAKIVLQNGGTAVIIGRRVDKTKAAVSELTPSGPVFGQTADITKTVERAALVERIDAQHRDAAMLLNAAGVFAPRPFLEHTEADYDRYLEISKAIFFITQRVAKNLVDRKKDGSIVNIGSMWAKQAVQATPSSAYSMAKAGLHSLTQHLAMELAGAGIRVNAVSPRSCGPQSLKVSFQGGRRHSASRLQQFPPYRPYRPARRRGGNRRHATIRQVLLGNRRHLGCRWRGYGGAQSIRLVSR